MECSRCNEKLDINKRYRFDEKGHICNDCHLEELGEEKK